MTRSAIIRKSSSIKSVAVLLSLCIIALCAGCHHSTMTIVNHGQDVINGHRVTITPCLHSANTTLRDKSPEDSLHSMKCGETEVVINNEELVVNGKSYGKLKTGAAVAVDNGRVLIDSTETKEVASR
jgi:hypothetical protein